MINKLKLLIHITKEILSGGGDIMITVYVTLIIRGAYEFKDVPEKLRDAVKSELALLGLDENGYPLED